MYTWQHIWNNLLDEHILINLRKNPFKVWLRVAFIWPFPGCLSCSYQCFTLMNNAAVFILLHKPTIVSTTSVNNFFVYLDARYWENYILAGNTHTHTSINMRNHVLKFMFSSIFLAPISFYQVKYYFVASLYLKAMKWRHSAWVEVEG